MSSRPTTIAFAASLLFSLFVATSRAGAATVARRFEPTDLELENPGTVELDMQFGATSGTRAEPSSNRSGRFFAPDYEIDIGLSSRFELDIDGAFAFAPLRDGTTKLVVGEPLWTSMKIGVLDLRNLGPAHAAAFGFQVGPRLPLGTDLRGIGFEVLTLTGIELETVHFVVNAGALLDPASADTRERPVAAVGGIDMAVDLEPTKHWSFAGELGGGYYFGGAPHQLTATGGVAYDTGTMQWSLSTLITLVGPDDRVGLLLGFAPKLRLFH